ncbi:MAG: SMC-Scp complex subunit ScpB, partial [Planctomycetales bacterium]|nr:SMC-Scp complex subunit ScpB [Planctomycetales bacterium]
LGCPYRIVAEGAGFRLTLAPAWNGLRQRFYGKMRDARLSPAAIEVLSLVAYRQPMTREQVDELRGKESGPLLRQLLRRRLLRLELGDGDGPRRQYTTTDRFLKLFGLESLAELPQTDEVESTH